MIMKKITYCLCKNIIIFCIFQLFTATGTIGGEVSVGDVHGGFTDEVNLTIYDSDISASAAQNWEFDTASAEPAEFKEAEISADKKNSHTENCDSLGFSFTSFTVKLSGEMNPLGSGSGPCERHFSISGNYDGDYYISPTEAEIPGRTSVSFTYTAKIKDLNTNEESDCSSTWNFHPSPYKHDYVNFTPTEQENTTAVTISNMATWKTPAPGSYSITAENYPNGGDDAVATLKVIGADFSNVNAPGYDDYTYWTPQNKYYTDRENSRCTKPCVSIKKGASCQIRLNISPTPSESVDIEAYGVSISPTSIGKSSSITVTSSSIGTATVKAFLNWTNHSGNAQKTEISYCSGKVYSEITKTVTLYKVNGHSLSIPISTLNNIFKQCALNFKLNSTSYTITKTPSGPNDTWTFADITAIKNDITPIGNNYAIVVFPGSYAPDHAIGGFVINKSQHMFIFNNAAGVIPHEMGHCLGLDDKYTYSPPIPPSNTGTFTPATDRDNLMNCGITKGKLRVFQWDKIRK